MYVYNIYVSTPLGLIPRSLPEAFFFRAIFPDSL